MTKVSFPLTRETKSREVADLQEALQLLIDRRVLLRDDDVLRRELSTALQRERVESTLGPGTSRLVGLFQEQRRLSRTGEVDGPTAGALNALLRELGVLEEAGPARSRVVSGTVRREDGLPLAGVRVRAFHETERGVIRLGEDTTDAEGRYTLRYEAPPEAGSVQLRVSAESEAGKLLASAAPIRNAGALEIVDLKVPVAGKAATEHRIAGRIVLDHGLPAEQLTVRLYRRDFGGTATMLAETTTLTGGQYAFTYAPSAAMSLEVRALTPANVEIPLSRPLNDLATQPRAVLDLVAPGPLRPLPAEYQRLTEAVTAHLGQLTRLAEAKENADRQDLTVLNRATGWDARLIALAATVEKLSRDAEVRLPREALYGLVRAGLPSDKSLLARVHPDVVERALKTGREAGVVGLGDPEIARVKQQFSAFATAVRLATPAPGSRSTYGQMLKTSGIGDDAQAKFASVYLEHRGDVAELWDKARKAGLDDTHIGTLQLQGKLAFLTGNSERLTARLQRTTANPAQLVDRDLHRADRWIDEIDAAAGVPAARRDNLTENDEKLLDAVIPPTFAGGSVEARRTLWAEDMARKVRLSYPTQVIGRTIETDRADRFKLGPARAATARLLKNSAAQGFRLGQTPVASFLRTHAGARAGMSAADFDVAQREMKTLQRVYQITPGDEAMQALLGLGLTSAFDVVAIPEDAFVERHGARFASPAQARLVYRKAVQVSSVTYNVFTIAKTLESELPVAGISAPVVVRDSVRNELIKHFPTMESLFGSMDFCECEHCRSVLSPAAYLVDLLQFIDAEPQVWSNFLVHWRETHGNEEYTARYKKPYDALVERRPDLPHIPLTCENTHTALPHIDLVNEILEYYVAHGRLDAAAANDTGDATTPELVAEPQNVIRDAYDKVREARYPLALPFDLWLETVRQFCDYFETPLWRVLEAFRPGNALLAPLQPYDRAAVFIESLGLSPAEAAIFTDPAPLATWFELYGFASAAEARTVATDAATNQRIDLNSAKALARRLGVSYKELVEIVQTGFVNPRLERLAVLHKLGVGIDDVRFCRDPQTKAFYEASKDLLDQERGDLPAADQLRFDALSTDDWQKLKEVQAFERRLQEFADRFAMPLARVEAALQAIAFDEILVLADPDAGCDLDLTTLRYASGRAAGDIDFLRINLFVRLWRTLGWSIEETDRALRTFVPAGAPFEAASLNRQPLRTALIYLAHLKALDDTLRVGKQSRLKLLTLWADLATAGKRPLYAQLFLGRSVLKTDDVFDEPLGQYLSPAAVTAMSQSRWHRVQGSAAPGERIDPAVLAAEPRIEVSYDDLEQVQHLAYRGVLGAADRAALIQRSPSPVLPALLDAVQAKAADFTLVKGHLLALQGALGLTADEVGRILEDAGTSLEAAALSLAHVSLLYRYALLARALKLSVRDLIALRRLAGLDPFGPLQAGPLTGLDEDHPFARTLRFVEVAEQVKDTGLKIDDLEFLLRHRFEAAGKYRPNREGTLALLKTLGEGIRAIRGAHGVPDDAGAMSDEVLRQKLGLALTPDVVERFLAMLNGTAEFTASRTGVAAADRLKPEAFTGEPSIREVRYDDTRQEQTLTFRGVLFDAEKAAVLARLPRPVPPAAHVPSPVLGALLDDVQAQARSYFEKHLQKQAPAVRPATGFLDAADFELLFGAPPAGLSDEQRQARIREQRTKLARAFLPFLQERLVRQFIAETLTAHTAADPALVEALLTDGRLLALPQAAGGPRLPLLSLLAATGGRGLTARFFASADATGAALASPVAAEADTGSRDGDGSPIRPAGANSASFEGYLEVPVAGAYRFHVVLEARNAAAEIRFEHLPNPVFWAGTAATDDAVLGDQPAQYLELKPGVPYRFTVRLRNLGAGQARVLVQGETLARDRLAQLVLYPLTALEGGERALVLLTKSLQLARALDLGERELRYVLTHAADFGNVDLGALPTRADDDSAAGATALFAQFLRLAGYARLKRDLAGGTDDLVGVFEANEAADLEKVYTLVATLTRRDVAVVKAVARALFPAPAFPSETPLRRLWDALHVVERFGVPVASVLEWTRIVSPAATAQQRPDIARDLKEAIKARFEPEAWQRVAQPIFDRLRQRQRDALVAHVMHQHGFARLEQLYEYFLIDPGMEPVVQSSRIRLAIGSLQLFVQRCLLNLEKQVHPSTINAGQWEWMKRYRVWEANRKIFLFPENWLEPEFRDDKTHLFSELEGALLQGDVSSDLVEDAFLAYLRKLEELARLDIVAMHLEDKADPAQNTLHVIGRTFGQPHKYFYRRYAHERWTPWEPVSAEIEGDHLAPVVWRQRLYLFWVTFLEKADPEAKAADGPRDGNEEKTLNSMTMSEMVGSVTAAVTRRLVEVQLHWSENLQGEWTTRESGGAAASLEAVVVAPFDPRSVFVHVSKQPYVDGEERGVFIQLGGAIQRSFLVAGRNSAPQRGFYGSAPAMPYGKTRVTPTRYVDGANFTVQFRQRISTEPGQEPAVETFTILEQGAAFTILPCDNKITIGPPGDLSPDAEDPAAVTAAISSGLAEIASLMKPVFYQNDAHTFFVEPTVTERTVEEWQEWVTRTVEPDPGWRDPDWWKDIVVKPEIPTKWPIPDPRPFAVDPGSLIQPGPRSDWLVNPGTALLFDGELIGPVGRAGLEIRPATEIDGAVMGGATRVEVHPGSPLGAGSTVVLPGDGRLETTGLIRVPGGVNVVGGPGFNSALARNFAAFDRSGPAPMNGGR